jgi:hypothetical protein
MKCSSCNSDGNFFDGFITFRGFLCRACKFSSHVRNPVSKPIIAIILLLAALPLAGATYFARYYIPSGFDAPSRIQAEEAIKKSDGALAIIRLNRFFWEGEGLLDVDTPEGGRHVRITIESVSVGEISPGKDIHGNDMENDYRTRATVRSSVEKLDRNGKYLSPHSLEASDEFKIFQDAKGEWEALIPHSLPAIY